MTSRFGRVFCVLALLWVGVIVGVSFVATPAKFQAGTLDLPTALDVGRHVFATSHLVQLAIAGLLGIVALHQSRRVQLVLFAAVGVLVIQQVLVLPLLVERAASIIDGARPDGRSPHLIYVALELGKLACAATAGVWSLSQGREPRAGALGARAVTAR